MREPVMKTPFSQEKILAIEQELYLSFLTPEYIFRKIRNIRNFHDFKYLFFMAKKLFGHLLDFNPHQKKVRSY